jgi:hypothetical protein
MNRHTGLRVPYRPSCGSSAASAGSASCETPWPGRTIRSSVAYPFVDARLIESGGGLRGDGCLALVRLMIRSIGPSPLSRSTPLHLNLPIATASGTRPCSDWHGTGTGSEAETQTPRDRRICGIRRCRRIPSSERRSRTEPVRRRQARRAALPSARQRERGNQRRRNRIPPKDVRAHSSGYIPLSAAGLGRLPGVCPIAPAFCIGIPTAKTANNINWLTSGVTRRSSILPIVSFASLRTLLVGSGGVVRLNSILRSGAPGFGGVPLFLLTNCQRAR